MIHYNEYKTLLKKYKKNMFWLKFIIRFPKSYSFVSKHFLNNGEEYISLTEPKIDNSPLISLYTDYQGDYVRRAIRNLYFDKQVSELKEKTRNEEKCATHNGFLLGDMFRSEAIMEKANKLTNEFMEQFY